MGRIPAPELESFVRALLAAYGVNPAQSASVARILLWSELVGRENFGLLRLPVLIKRLQAGVLNGDCRPRFEASAPGTGLLHGDGGFGHYVGEVAMDHAIALARQAGIGAVGVRDSNFFGAGARFVHQAAQAGMIGLALSNSFPKVAAHGGILPVLGTNPFAFGAPQRDGRSLMLDMATSALAGSTVREHIDKGLPLPEGLAVDGHGVPITDPAKIDEGALLPFGGAKGFGLSLMVEILAGVIAGAGIGQGVASMYKDFTARGDNGHFMLALDISRWMTMDEYYQRFDSLIAMVKASGSEGRVLVPGELRWQRYDETLPKGIEVPNALQDTLARLSMPHGIPFPKQ